MDLSKFNSNASNGQAQEPEVTAVAETSNEAVTSTDTTEVSGVQAIPAVNPTAEEMKAICETIREKYKSQVDVKPVKFNFKKYKDESGIEFKRDSLELAIPVPSVQGIISILEAEDGGKQLELLRDAIESVIIAAARDLITDDQKLNASTFPYEKISWEAIANMPKAQRRGGGIPKETWEDFVTDYVAVMPAVTGKSVEQVTNAAKIMQNRLSAVKTNVPVLELLVEQLAIYAEHSQNAEEYKEVIEFLLNKADAFLNTSPEELLANL